MDFIRPMLAAAAGACRLDGVVLIILPPIGTRLSADAEREAAIRFAARLGLDLLDYRPLAIAYDTPFFERNALAAAGVYAPPGWRRGDLVVFRKSRRAARHIEASSGRRRNWVEISIGRMRLFVKPDDKAASGLEGSLIPVIDNDILPSVSRRDPRRRGVQVWTSGNRIFPTDNAKLVIEAAHSRSGEEIGSGVQPRLWGNLRKRDAVERVGQMLADLAAHETGEESWLAASPGRGMLWTSSLTSSFSGLMATVSG